MPEKKLTSIVLHNKDNVAVAIEELNPGDKTGIMGLKSKSH